MGENDYVARRSSQACESKGTRLLWFCTLSWKNSWTSSINWRMEATQTWNCSMRFRGRWQRTESHLKSSEIESSSCRCTTTSIGRKMETYRCVSRILEKLRPVHKRFFEGHWSFSGRGTEETWYGTHTYKPEGLWNRSAVMIMCHLRESGDLVFRASASDRGALKKQGGKLSIHYGDSSTAELLFRIITSVNELGVHGATDWLEELAQQVSDPSFSSTGKPRGDYARTVRLSTLTRCRVNLNESPPTNVLVQGNLLRSHSQRFETLPEDM